MSTVWKKRVFDINAAEQLSAQLPIDKNMAILLNQRGIHTTEAARHFLHSDLDSLTDPLLLSGMQAACARIARALENDEAILIYGDYDVDGMCSIALLHECFAALGQHVAYYVPDRFSEGYGLNLEALRQHAENGIKLVITVDCGITSCAEAEFCKSAGMDMIITDHHMPASELPDATAIINPKLDDLAPTKNLAGVGVAFKLAVALFITQKKEIPVELLHSWLELTCLATVADIVPLLEENRTLVRHGLPLLQHTRRPGLKLLLEKLGLSNQVVRSWHISFLIAPKLNSAGRLDSAAKSIELLLTRDPQQADLLTDFLLQTNQQRKDIEDEIVKQATEQLAATFIPESDKILCVSGENWNVGVIGIVASRLLETFHRPVIVISWEGDIGRGSCRSLGDINILNLLAACSELLVEFGGHKLAAGITINRNDFSDFQSALQTQTALIISEDQKKTYHFDLELLPEEVTPALLKNLEQLEPFGEGNPAPRFVMRQQRLLNPVGVGKQREHLKFNLPAANHCQVIAFNQAADFSLAAAHLKHDLLFELKENEFRGQKNLQLNVFNFKPSIENAENTITSPVFNHLRCLQTLAANLADSEPSFLLFPDVPTLNMFVPWLTAYFDETAFKVVHGFLPSAPRQVLFNQMSQNSAQIFAITLAAWLHFLKTSACPENLLNLYSIDPQASIAAEQLQKSGSPIPAPLWQAGTISNDVEFLFTETIPAHTKIYFNQAETLELLSPQLDTPYRDTPQETAQDFFQRLKLRQTWAQKPAAFFTNADFIPCAEFDQTEKALMLADPFYSVSELMLFTLNSDIKGKTKLLIHPQAQEMNLMRQRLSDSYPHANTITDFIRVLATLPMGGLSLETGVWITAINQRSALQINTVAELEALLTVTAELSLCEWEKHGNIFSIKSEPKNFQNIDLTKSLYYMEGLTSKKAYWEIEQILQKQIDQHA